MAEGTQYAILLDLLAGDERDADIRRFLADHGFGLRQGLVYFGDRTVDAVSCVLTVQQMVKEYPWVRFCVKDIRMLRIEESVDLSAAIPLGGSPRRSLRLVG